MKQHKFKHITAFFTALVLIAALFPVSVFAATDEEIVVDVNSGAERSNSFITINEELKDKAKGLNLIMYGLTEDNKDAVIDIVSSTFDSSKEQVIKYVDDAFVDAEKFNAAPDEENAHPYDHALCWAGSISNLLWMSGWAENLSSPLSGKEFLSEDDVFTYFNSRFTDSGSDSASAIEFFFQGNYFDIPTHPHTHLNYEGDRSQRGLQTASDGFMKNIAAACLTEKRCLSDDVSAISEFENICSEAGDDTVFQISVGELFSENSVHSVNAVGIIIDPNETSLEERYKAIILANTDNDGYPDTLTDEATDSEKEADKAKRTNSYTLYPLKLAISETGKQDWEIVGYSTEERTALYSFTALKVKTDQNVEMATETEGTKNSLENVDLFVETVFTTDSEEPVADYPDTLAKEKTVTEFKYGKAVNLNFYLQNRTSIILDSKYTEAKSVPVKYTVVKRPDSENEAERKETVSLAIEAGGEIIKTQTYECELPIYSNLQNVCFLNLNKEDGKLVAWEDGIYDVYLEINPVTDGSRTVTEAYYKNNEASCTFEILEDTPESTTEEESTTEKETTTAKETTTEEKTTTVAETTTTPETQSIVNNNESSKMSAADTADTNDVSLYLVIIILSGDVIIGTVYLFKRRL